METIVDGSLKKFGAMRAHIYPVEVRRHQTHHWPRKFILFDKKGDSLAVSLSKKRASELRDILNEICS